MSLYKTIFFFIFFLSINLVNAQYLKFEHISEKDGLVNSSVTAIVKDSNDFMWFGTFDGLCRFDGYNFKKIIPIPDQNDMFEDHRINALYASKDGIIYVGFQTGGICLYDKKKDTYEKFTCNKKNKNGISSNTVNIIYGDKAGNIWIGTDKGLDKFDPKTKIFKASLPNESQLINNYINSIAEDGMGNLWLYGLGNKVCRFNPRMNTFAYYQFSDTPGLNTYFDHLGELAYDSKGNLWVSNELDGVTHFNIATGEKEVFSRQNGKIKSNIVTSIQEMSDGTIWIGTDGTGLYIYNYKDSTMQRYYNNASDINSLAGEGVYCVYESEPGMIWVGTYTTGLNISKKNKKKFETFGTKGIANKVLNQRSVLSICKASDTAVWLGTDGGGLNYFNHQTGTFKYYTKENSTITSNVIKSIKSDNEGNIWCGTYREGLCKFNLRKSEALNLKVNVDNSEQGIKENSIWALEVTNQNELWMGLLTSGIDVYNLNSKKILNKGFKNDDIKKFANCNVQKIFQDSKNRIWFGTETFGLGCYFTDNNKIEWFDQHRSNLLSNDVQDIFEDHAGFIWIGTQKGGLYKLIDFQNKIFVSYTSSSGLPSNNIRKILEDGKNNLWISTDKGISNFKISENLFYNFDIDDGLLSHEFNPNSGIEMDDGYMYFGGINGLNRFHPDSIHFNTVIPKIALTDFKIFNKSIKINQEYGDNIYLKKAIGETSQINLSYEDYVFSIEFSALSYIAPMGNKYAYMMEGFTKNWTFATADKRIATYTNLDPGDYVFKVIGSNNDGVWNRKGYELKISISPPWWKTIAFKIGIIMTGLTLGGIFFYMREKSIQSKNKLLENEVKTRTVELLEKNNEILEKNNILKENNFKKLKQNDKILALQEEVIKQKDALENSNKTKEKFFTIIGRDLKTPAHNLTKLIDQLKIESEKFPDKTYQELMLHVDHSTTRIQNLILNLLEWAKTQSANIVVKSTIFKVESLIVDNFELIKQQALAKKIQLVSNVDASLFIEADYNMASTVLRNILSNSIKFTPEGGVIEIGTLLSDDKVSISVKDSGVGMSEAIRKKLFKMEESFSTKGTNNEKGTGLGLLISQEFMNLNHGTISVSSEEGKGTTFYLNFKNQNIRNTL